MRGYGTSRRNYLADTQMIIIIIWENRRARARVESQCESEQFTWKFVTNWGRYSQSFLRTRNNYFGAAAPVQCQCDFG